MKGLELRFGKECSAVSGFNNVFRLVKPVEGFTYLHFEDNLSLYEDQVASLGFMIGEKKFQGYKLGTVVFLNEVLIRIVFE